MPAADRGTGLRPRLGRGIPARHLAAAQPRHRPARSRTVRFGGIPQPWLKDLAKRWCRWRLATGLSAGLPARGARVLARFGSWLACQPERSPAPRRSPGRCWNATSPPCMPSSAAGSCKESTSRSLNGFLTAVRQHEWDPGLPASAMIFPEDYPARGERLPRALAEHVMAQIEDPANLDRWDDPGRPADHAHPDPLRAADRRRRRAARSTASSATPTAPPTCATTTTR